MGPWATYKTINNNNKKFFSCPCLSLFFTGLLYLSSGVHMRIRCLCVTGLGTCQQNKKWRATVCVYMCNALRPCSPTDHLLDGD